MNHLVLIRVIKDDGLSLSPCMPVLTYPNPGSTLVNKGQVDPQSFVGWAGMGAYVRPWLNSGELNAGELLTALLYVIECLWKIFN